MEVAMIIVGLALAWIFLRPVIFPQTAMSKRLNCVNNQKQITLAFRMWSNDGGDKFMWAVSTNDGGTKELVPLMAPEMHFRVASNQLSTPKYLICPSDLDRAWTTNWNSFTRSNLSYFVNLDADETRPDRLLIGDRNLMINSNSVKPGLALITTNQNLGWDKTMHNECGNIGLSDGSVQQVTSTGLMKQFQASALQYPGFSLATNRLVIP